MTQGKKVGVSISVMEQSQPQDYSEPQREETYGLHRCSFHPDVETGLACGRCGKYICPRCMIQTPVGARCPECARVTKLPTFDVRPSYYFRAVVAGVASAVVSGLLWGVVLSLHVPFLPWLSAIGVGYVVGEAISVAVNRKRGPGLGVVAGLSIAIAVVTSGFVSSVHLLSNIFGLPTVGMAIFMAVSRVRR